MFASRLIVQLRPCCISCRTLDMSLVPDYSSDPVVRRKRSPLTVILVSVVLVICLGIGSLCMLFNLKNRILGPEPVDKTWTSVNIATSKARGDKIVAALSLYRERHGKYPLRLEELIPSELPSIDSPTAGKRVWSYDSDGTRYGISFDSTVSGNTWDRYTNDLDWSETSRERN